MNQQTQLESVRHGVHLEHIAVNRWRMTGRCATVYISLEDRKLSKEMRAALHSRQRTYPQWVVRERENEDGSPFPTAIMALSRAYEKAGALPLEI